MFLAEYLEVIIKIMLFLADFSVKRNAIFFSELHLNLSEF